MHLLSEIDNSICKQHTDSFKFNMRSAHYQFDRFMELQKQQQQIEDNVLELEREKRKEYLECWKDLMFLKKYLMMALKQYWDLVKRQEILSDDFQ